MISWRALALLSVAAALFVASVIPWLQHPTNKVALYVVLQGSLILVAIASSFLGTSASIKASRRR
jgi:hypothetical protein